MRRRLGAAAITVVFFAPTAAGSEPTIRERSVEKFGRDQVQRYAHLHRKWTHRAGKDVVGRQVVKYGMPRKGSDRVASRREWRRTLAVFDRWENPPPPSEPVWASSTPPGSVASYGGPYAIPTEIVMCESGGDPNAVNPSSGAYGLYQILPSTAAAYGCDLATVPGQDACAAEIWAGGAGRSQWAC
jgi:hypothetical protein